MWDYETVLQQLEQTGQCCPFTHGDQLESCDGYSCSNLQISSILDASKRNLQHGKECIDKDSDKPNQQQVKLMELGYKTQMGQRRSKTLTEQNDETDDLPKEEEGIRKRRRRSQRLNIKARLIRLRDRILNNRISSFSRSLKRMRSVTETNLDRRSKYIGVSKSSVHWQALINVKKVKKYIGTFSDEIQAARVYDLYAVALQGQKASLNFNYTPQEMLETVENYIQHQRV
ncbi:unnamed protein product [Moneuplotes crassus]|uniref:AP2/ERF domain-containing protein n=1 Tax=Euplotes crassus TaxID=5936 RepID=A0AAD1Y9D2_EUPCR|nr:unnamed protein product [Moneuplotes crassus]